MTMKQVIRWVIWAVMAFFVYKAALWSYDVYKTRDRTPAQQEVFDLDKECIMDADTGRCFCRHRRTGENLRLPYEECKSRALNPQ